LTMTHHATNLDLPSEANITTAAGDVATFQSTGSNTVQCINYTRADGTAIVAGGIASVAADGSPQLGGFLDANGNYMQTEKGGDITSASPLVIDTDGDYFDVTGTTNFAAMTVAADRQFTLQFDGALTMTHHATNLDLPGEANITTAAGDVGVFQSTGSNTVQCISYVKADGTAVVGSVEGTAVLSTGEAGGTKYLREDGDGTCSWQTAGAGDAILGDTAGNKLRVVTVRIVGQGSSNIKCKGYHDGIGFNISANYSGSTSASFTKSGSATVGSGATEVTYSLHAAGVQLTVNMVEAITNIIQSGWSGNDTGVDTDTNCSLSDGNLQINFKNSVTGANIDISGIGSGTTLDMQFLLIIGGGG